VSDPVVTVVIPTLNAGRTIRDCLQSVRGQAGPSFEVLVVDALSTDGTLDVCRNGADRVIQNDCGMTRARLIGAEAARGEFVLNLDADQRLRDHAISAALETGQSVVAFGEVNVGSSVPARVNRLENELRGKHWRRNIGRIGGALRPRFYRRELLLRALRAIPPAVLDTRPCPFSEDTLIFVESAVAEDRVGFVPAAIEHLDETSTWSYWKKWVRYGRAARALRGTRYEDLVRRRGGDRLRTSLSPGTLPAFLLRAPAFAIGYLSADGAALPGD
jgi:glycosyltransferase involved in cell wall biosynthesis